MAQQAGRSHQSNQKKQQVPTCAHLAKEPIHPSASPLGGWVVGWVGGWVVIIIISIMMLHHHHHHHHHSIISVGFPPFPRFRFDPFMSCPGGGRCQPQASQHLPSTFPAPSQHLPNPIPNEQSLLALTDHDLPCLTPTTTYSRYPNPRKASYLTEYRTGSSSDRSFLSPTVTFWLGPHWLTCTDQTWAPRDEKHQNTETAWR